MTENKMSDTSPTQSEDAELSASEMEGVVGGGSRGSDNVWVTDQNQGGTNFTNQDDDQDPSSNLPYAPTH